MPKEKKCGDEWDSKAKWIRETEVMSKQKNIRDLQSNFNIF